MCLNPSSIQMLTNKAKYKAVQEEIQDISRALKDSTNNLVHSLKENPDVSGNIIKIQRDRAELVDVLRRTTQEIADKGTFACLVQRVEEHKLAQRRLDQLKQREQELNAAVARLERELTEEQAAYEHTVAEQRATVAHLKSELADVRSTTHGDTKLKLVHLRCELNPWANSVSRGLSSTQAKGDDSTDVVHLARVPAVGAGG